MAKLQAKGRIYGELSGPRAGSGPSPAKGYNIFGKIDGARFVSHDAASGTVTLRVDHTEIPEFWCEVRFTQRQLEDFLAATAGPAADEEEEEEEETSSFENNVVYE